MKRAPGPAAFLARGVPQRDWFPHEVARLAKAYPDTYLQLERRGLTRDEAIAGRPLQLNLYATDLEGLPDELFTDRTLNWHGQQLGRKGHVASAGAFCSGDTMVVTLLQSDLCQQLFRHPVLRAACRSRVDNRFGHWHTLLTNAVLDLARDDGVATVLVPTAHQILSTTRKTVDAALFERIYDTPAHRYVCERVRLGAAEYWAIPVAANSERIVPLEPLPAPAPAGDASGVAVVLFHDVEENVDTAISAEECGANLTRMLAVEAAHGVRATYNVLGALFRAKRDEIARGGHALAFHSYDHRVEALDQLARVRTVDLQIRGYRPPRSVLTGELTDYALAYRNFDWLLCSARSLGFADCQLANGIAKIPVHLDDWDLQTGRADVTSWRARLTRLLAERRLVAVGLHDCYARHWLPWYDDLLAELATAGELVTCDELADRLFLASTWASPCDGPGAANGVVP